MSSNAVADVKASLKPQGGGGAAQNQGFSTKRLAMGSSMLKLMESLNPRNMFSRFFEQKLNRNLYTAFGWDAKVSPKDMWAMYNRGGIAHRIVHSYADAVWGSPPEVQVKANKKWVTSWDELAADQNIWSILNRLDSLSQLGQYAILLVGIKGSGKLDTALKADMADSEILFLQPYSDRSAVITAWGIDPTDERFNLPTEYTIYPNRAMQEDGQFQLDNGSKIPSPGMSFKVHWSRVIHVAQGQLEHSTFGTPKLWAVWNYLTDLMKVVGASSESYWQMANRGMHVNIDPELDLEEEDEASLSQEVAEYIDGQRRFIRTRGAEVKSLGSDVANPDGPAKLLVTLIAGTSRIPQRILTGSEAAHNASTQDKGNWADAVDDYRQLTSTPCFMKPLIEGFIRMGVLGKIKLSKVMLQWPNAYKLSPLESAQKANQRAAAANNLAQAVTRLPNLIDRQEAREWVDLPADDKGDELEIDKTVPASGKSGDGGGASDPGSEGGDTATTGSDSNGNGDPPPKQK